MGGREGGGEVERGEGERRRGGREGGRERVRERTTERIVGRVRWQ